MTQRSIFWFWVPLAASWALMNLEAPIVQAAIARLPEATTMLAAAGVVISLEILIESPIIMLLGTSTALTTTPQAYHILRRFMIHMNLGLATIAAALAFIDPLYHAVVGGLMGIPPPIATAAQKGMQIMFFWSMAIGWRRFYQGILIHFGRPRQVSYGTMVRLTAVAFSAMLLVAFTDWSGIVVGGCIWMTGVSLEAVYIDRAAQPVVVEYLSGPTAPTQPILTYKQVIAYHAPLAATSLLSLLAPPLIGAGLARMAFPQENLAAWPVVWSIILFFRSFGFALPETIIALLKKPTNLIPLRRFCMSVAAASSVLMTGIAFTPLITFYLLNVVGIPRELTRFVIPGLLASLLIPALAAIGNWFRGVLMTSKTTGHIYWGMGINLLVTALGVGLGVLLQTPGVPTAAVTLSVAMLAEIAYLWWRTAALHSFQTPD